MWEDKFEINMDGIIDLCCKVGGGGGRGIGERVRRWKLLYMSL